MIDPDALERFRFFELIERLSPRVQDELLRRASAVLSFEPGEIIYVQGQIDNFISYLLHGRVERLVDGTVETFVDAGEALGRHPLDGLSEKRDTLRATTAVTVLRLNRRELERALRTAHSDSQLEVTDIAADTSEDWYTRFLRSPLFGQLSASTIHSIFNRMEELNVSAGVSIVRQGEVGEHYYVVQSGLCEVVRLTANGSREIKLATLGPGSGFGEEALITDQPRNATVRMLSDGEVRRLDKADFHDLVLASLVRGVSFSQARWLVEQGARWIDSRERALYAQGSLVDALNIPPHLLRVRSKTLDPAQDYVVCHDVVGTSMLGAFLLCERGFDACYLEEPVSAHASPSARAQVPGAPASIVEAAVEKNTATSGAPTHTESPESDAMNEPKRSNGNGRTEETARNGAGTPGADERLPREEFAETTTGEELADLIDELYEHREALEQPVAHAGDSPVAAPAAVRAAGPVPPTSTSRESTSGGPVDVDAGNGHVPTTTEVVTAIMDRFDALERSLTEQLRTRREALRSELEARLTHIEHAADERLEVRERALAAHYEQIYAEKERSLRSNYDRLTALANRISQQKAEINSARQSLESMLQTANRVHREVARAGNSLVEQLGHLGDIGDDIELH